MSASLNMGEHVFGAAHNGWSNYATWSAQAWLSNVEKLYDRARECEIHPRAFQDLCNEIWPDGLTPDGASLDDVNWYELAWAWDEE